MKISQQKASDKIWKDEAGVSCQYSRTTKFEREVEKFTYKTATAAQALHDKLVAFKKDLSAEAERVFQVFLDENGGKRKANDKGNVTLYNFDRSLKIEVSIDEMITFDDNTIMLAKERLDEFITKNTGGIDLVVKEMIMSAFETSRGRMDTKKVLALKRHKDRIKDPLFTAAVDLIDKAIRRPDKKKYFRVWVKDEVGKYQNIDLQFSSL